jgi:cell wall-associated NlpC family hydrolase
MADDGISGLGVGAVAAGLLLITSAIRNETPLDTLRKVIGKAPTGGALGTAFASVASSVPVITGRSIGKGGDSESGVAGTLAVQSSALVKEAQKYLGVPYRFGGVSKSGVDCSGLVVLALRGIGINCPRFYTSTFDSWALSQGAKKVANSDFREGDIIRRPGHMAIALSATTMIHAPHTGTVVKVAKIYSINQWWGFRL